MPRNEITKSPDDWEAEVKAADDAVENTKVDDLYNAAVAAINSGKRTFKHLDAEVDRVNRVSTELWKHGFSLVRFTNVDNDGKVKIFIVRSD